MIEKNAYLNKLREMNGIFSKYDFLQQALAQSNQLKEAIEDYAFRVVLIGGFSSGKSALLNRLAGRQLFKENLGPETALPAEVSWAPVESCMAVFADGHSSPLPLATATANPPENALFLSIKLENEFLKKRPELILVDFPGFDSNVDAHNAAISAYLKKGSAFLLLVPAPNGALTSSDIKFLKEAAAYPQALGCFISKSDVRQAEKCDEIASYVRDGIAMHYGDTVPVIPISIMPDCVADFEERFATMVDRFNPQELFNLSLAPAINELLYTGIYALQEYASANELDSSDLDKRIREGQELYEDLARELEKEKAGLNRKYQYELIPSILAKLDNAFHANIDTLVQAAQGGHQRFGAAVQNIARPILATVPGEIQADLRDTISKMHIGSTQNEENANSIKDALLNIVDVISTFIPTGNPSLPKGAPRPGTPGGPLPTNSMAGMGTGLLVGLMGNPVLGAVIALAPTLINFFFGNRQPPQNPGPSQAVRAQIENQGIPAIMNHLESVITPAVMETRDQLFNEIEQKIKERQVAATQAMELAKQEKEARKQEFTQSQAQVEADISALRQLLI